MSVAALKNALLLSGAIFGEALGFSLLASRKAKGYTRIPISAPMIN